MSCAGRAARSILHSDGCGASAIIAIIPIIHSDALELFVTYLASELPTYLLAITRPVEQPGPVFLFGASSALSPKGVHLFYKKGVKALQPYGSTANTSAVFL